MSVKSITNGGRLVKTDAFNVVTSVVGADFVALPTIDAHEFRLNNDTGFSLEVRRVGGTAVEVIPDDSSAEFKCVDALDEWELRRADEDNGQVVAIGSYVELS
jgi:hypothetical protein